MRRDAPAMFLVGEVTFLVGDDTTTGPGLSGGGGISGAAGTR